MIFRVGLVAAVVALGFGVVYLGAGGLGLVVGGVGSTLGGFVSGVTSTPTPRATIASITDPPSLQQPSEPYTNQPTVDLLVTVPAGVGPEQGYKIRVYLQLPDQAPTAIQDASISDAAKTVIPGVELTNGVNDFSVTIVGPAGESEPSLVVRYILDATPPKITITSPKANAIVNGQAVSIKGKTQARTTLLARNDANGSSIAATAEPDGTFALSLALSPGVNTIAITGTDPAGNVTEMSLSLRRGSGELAVALGSSVRQIKRSRLPEPVTLTATVTDPDGTPLAGADVTFTLSIPGVGPITTDMKTGSNGKASFRTTVPKGADLGQGGATVLVTSSEFGSTQDHIVISIVK